MSKYGSVRELLAATPVSSVKLGGSLTQVASSESFEAAFSKLVDNSILSAPVFDESSKKYVGFLDMRDLVSIVLSVHGASGKGAETEGKGIDALLKVSRENHVYAADGPTVTYMARRNPFIPVKSTANLCDVLDIFTAKRVARVHRVPVVDENDKVINIITQMSLISFLAENAAQVAPTDLAGQIDELKIGSFPAITVQDSLPAHAVFTLMDKEQRSGVAIVNELGTLVGNISGRDLKQFIKQPSLSKLDLSIKEFLAQLRAEQVDIRAPAISCVSNVSVGGVLAKLSATRVHRLYVVNSDKDFKPIGVVSLTDVLGTWKKVE